MAARYDLIIVGAGCVGAALALSLAGTGLSIAVIEQRAPRDAEADPRAYALSLASQGLLGTLGVWAAIQDRAGAYREMQVRDAEGAGAIHMDCAEIAAEALGWIVGQEVLAAALWARMQACADITLLHPAVLEALMLEDTAARVRLADGRELTAALVVGADGAQSRVRALAGMTVERRPYAQRAITCTLRTEYPHGETARQRFLPGGPLALLPRHDGNCSLVWSTSDAEAARLLALDTTAFCAEVERASAAVLGRVLDCGPRAAFPLVRQHAPEYTRARLALVGDAAHTVHPLAGQGVNLGLMDVAVLAEEIKTTHRAGRDLGATTHLRCYERARKSENLLMMGAMEGLHRLFTAEWPPLRLLRNAGLSFTDRLTPVKRTLMEKATGL